jgi:monofunctional biosynthetic peptidoglycan transglycosylase
MSAKLCKNQCMSIQSSLSLLRQIVIRSVLWFGVASVTLVVVFRFVPVPLTPLMLIRSGTSVFSDDLIGIQKDWVPLKEMAPSIQTAVLMAEDFRFFEHRGFDFEAIQKAMQYNQTHSKKKGASTISQQTAKNVFLWPSRTWVRKGFEAYFTVLIEAIWPKERIMEVYLNVIELGPGVYGVEAASQKYFKRKAKNLNSAQANLIAAVLPNPNKFRIDRPSKYVLARQRRIMNRAAPAIPKRQVSLIEFIKKDFALN